jgi:guanylate kinase
MNALKHISEFQSLLAEYKLSSSAIETLKQTNLALLVGPTGAGRNTIVTELLKTGDYYHIVSDTTRELRLKDGIHIEKNGREYWFRSEEDVLADLRKGEYVEAAIIHKQQVSGWNVREIEAALKAQKIAIKDIEPSGAAWVHRIKKDVMIIFVVPPSFDVWMSRLRSRSELPEDEIRRRLQSACDEMHTALTNDYYAFVVNDKLEDAVVTIHDITKNGIHDKTQIAAAREVVEQLYKEATEYLQ